LSHGCGRSEIRENIEIREHGMGFLDDPLTITSSLSQAGADTRADTLP
jgi:hypothetical protein